MLSLARGQYNNTSLLNWFLTLADAAFDAFEIGFRIVDLTAGPPGVQVFPAVDGTYELVTTAPGRFAQGCYYAYDNAAGHGWAPDVAADLGTYQIEWRWKDDAGSSYQFGTESFLVTATSTSSEPLYIPVSVVRAAGIPNPPDDLTVESAIRTWQKAVEMMTRQWFYPKQLTLNVDGTDSDALHFGVPIIGVDELRLNDDDAALDTKLYRVYNTNELHDRKNPRIKLIDSWGQQRDIFAGPDRYGRLRFRKGRQNQYIRGTFGYIEPDGSVPLLIQRAVLLLVIEKLANPPYVGAGSPAIPPPPIIAGPLLEEWTDGHRLRYAMAGGDVKPRQPGLLGLTNNPEVLRIMTLYRAPIGVATPANPTYR